MDVRAAEVTATGPQSAGCPACHPAAPGATGTRSCAASLNCRRAGELPRNHRRRLVAKQLAPEFQALAELQPPIVRAAFNIMVGAVFDQLVPRGSTGRCVVVQSA